MQDGAGATNSSPRNVVVGRWNHDLIHPPATDAGTLPNLTVPYQWLASTPPELVQQTLQVDAQGLRKLQKHKQQIL